MWSNKKIKRERQHNKKAHLFEFVPASILNQKVPQKVIQFYEKRISFEKRGSSSVEVTNIQHQTQSQPQEIRSQSQFVER
jgi:hypothetical protein